jgi:hypothetical protein
VQESEITADLRMTGHIRARVKTDDKAGPGDDQAKEQAQTVKAKPQVQVQARYPGPLELKHTPADHIRPEKAQSYKEQQRHSRDEQSQAAVTMVMVIRFR